VNLKLNHEAEHGFESSVESSTCFFEIGGG
jgi:hypothetical protein